jgi:hypothetical protein
MIAVLLALNAGIQWQALQHQFIVAWPPFNQVEQVQAAAAALRADYAQNPGLAGQPLLTFNTHLALEAGLDTPPGFEMAIFSYRPEWTTAQAQQNHAINNQMLLDYWQKAAQPVALTEFDLQRLFGDRDALLAALHDNYRWTRSIPRFGPFFDDLRIYLPRRSALPQPQVAQPVRLAGGIRFLGYDLERETSAGAEKLRLGLYWQASGPTDAPLTVFTHLLDESGALAAGQDNQPCHNTCPSTAWAAGEVIRDEYVLPLDARGRYTLEVGMYDPATGQRVMTLPDAGATVDDRIMLKTVIVED